MKKQGHILGNWNTVLKKLLIIYIIFIYSIISKATVADPSFVPAWMGYGHSFAMLDEHDQAMAAYRAGFRITSFVKKEFYNFGFLLIKIL